ncbi:MAG: hypothetical protein ACI8UO_003498 [Verrucomicrobiales bacterium]|jgi:hypothetical protein
MKITIALSILIGSASFALADDSLVVETKSSAPAPAPSTAPAPSPTSVGKEVMAPISTPSLGKQVMEHIDEIEEKKGGFVEVGAGLLWTVDGDFTKAFKTSVDKTNFGAKEDKTAASLNGLSFDEIFGEAHSFSARFGRAFGKKNLYLRISHTEASGGTSHLGEIGDCDLFGNFGNYSDWGVLVGFERQLNEAGRVSPYFGLEAGVRFVSGVDVDFRAENGHHGMDFNNVGFYEDSVVFSAEFVVGVDFDVTNNFALGVETGLRYQSGLDEDDSSLSNFGLEDLNNAGSDFLGIPVMVTGTVSF